MSLLSQKLQPTAHQPSKTDKGLEGEELCVVAENVKLYNEAIKNAISSMNTSSSEANKNRTSTR